MQRERSTFESYIKYNNQKTLKVPEYIILLVAYLLPLYLKEKLFNNQRSLKAFCSNLLYLIKEPLPHSMEHRLEMSQ